MPPDAPPSALRIVVTNALTIATKPGLPIALWNTLLKSGILDATTAAGIYAVSQPALAVALDEFLRRFSGSAEPDAKRPMQRVLNIVVAALNGGVTVGGALAFVEESRSDTSEKLVTIEAGAIVTGLFGFGILDALWARYVFRSNIAINREHRSFEDWKALFTEMRSLPGVTTYLGQALPNFAAFALYPPVHQQLQRRWEDAVSPRVRTSRRSC